MINEILESWDDAAPILGTGYIDPNSLNQALRFKFGEEAPVIKAISVGS